MTTKERGPRDKAEYEKSGEGLIFSATGTKVLSLEVFINE